VEPFDKDVALENYYEIYDLDTMGDLIKQESIDGTGSTELNALMEKLMQHEMGTPRPDGIRGPWPAQMNADELKNTLTEIAGLRNIDPEHFIAQYEKYQTLKPETQPVMLDTRRHPNFLGKEQSMDYGLIVGEVLGIDPVLAIMLNPTGGLVGPGNFSVPMPDQSPISNHGIYHDASGYLKKYHDIGRGYDYISNVRGPLDTNLPIAGQDAGIDWWQEQQRIASGG
ncbi:MAG: hypothetical protein AAF633_08025, partial [Chloroflexota bacterium]